MGLSEPHEIIKVEPIRRTQPQPEPSREQPVPDPVKESEKVPEKV